MNCCLVLWGYCDWASCGGCELPCGHVLVTNISTAASRNIAVGKMAAWSRCLRLPQPDTPAGDALNSRTASQPATPLSHRQLVISAFSPQREGRNLNLCVARLKPPELCDKRFPGAAHVTLPSLDPDSRTERRDIRTVRNKETTDIPL